MLSAPMQYKSSQNHCISWNALISNANVRRHTAVAYIVIWRFAAGFDLQHDKLLSFLSLDTQNNFWNRVYPGFYCFTYFFGISLCIRKADKSIVVCYTKEQITANTIG